MSAVCFRCGSKKRDPLDACSACEVIPSNEEEKALSVALSSQFSTPQLLDLLSTHLRTHGRVEVPQAILIRAREVVRGPQPRLQNPSTGTGDCVGAASKAKTGLQRNPFAVLGASVRDTERRLVELESERSVGESADSCIAACNELRNPRTRLRAEVAWLPGLSPSRTSELVNLTGEAPEHLRAEMTVPPLARANLLASILESGREASAEVLADWVVDLGQTADRLNGADVARSINEDRMVAQIPVIRSVEAVDAELAERRKSYQSIVVARLDSLDAAVLCKVMTKTVAAATAQGSEPASTVVDEVAALYEAKAAAALATGAAGVRKILAELPATSNYEESAVIRCVEQLNVALLAWSRVAKPVQLAMKARGQRHPMSHELIAEIRQTAGAMWDRRPILAVAQKMTSLLQDVFSDLPDWTEALDSDKSALGEREEEKRWEAELGAVNERCDQIMGAATSAPQNANAQAILTLSAGAQTCAQLKEKGVPSRLIDSARDRFAMAVLHCVVEYGKASQLWTECIGLAQRGAELAAGAEATAAFEGTMEALRKREKRMVGLKPIRSAPSLSTVNGIGAKMYGATDRDPEDGSYLTTLYFVIFFLPIFPIARYRVVVAGNNSYQFIGKAPLRPFDKWHIAAVAAGILAMIIYANVT